MTPLGLIPEKYINQGYTRDFLKDPNNFKDEMYRTIDVENKNARLKYR